MSLKLEALTQKYLYGATALSSLSLECAEGEKIAVLAGEEGGKTSLLKCIAGLYPATEGRIFIDGKDVTFAKIKDRGVMLVHSDGGLIKRMSLRKNLELPLKIRKLPKEQRKLLVEKVASDFGIAPVLDDFAYKLFPEDRLRAALARTAIRQSPVVLIDDIFALVPSGRRKAMFVELLPKLRALRRSAVLFATSSAEEAMSAGDRVLVLHFGMPQQMGTPREVKDSPATLVVDRWFNPYKNRMEAEVETDADGVFVRLLNKRYPVSVPYGNVGKKVICSFCCRAEEGGALPISDYFYDGDTLWVRCGGLFAKADGHYPARGYKITIEETSIQLFGADSEKRLT
jgi:multiple sugar transport system ATP-binding protein